ncbi:hypothetical protein HNP52_002565 [Sphingomonas kyeonggiensis]|uniref:Lipoprotein n=1 Tax=Sphingomonas kyeonggiensis TaxID=1268553 RepID=A0A7W7K2H9_9SPHN|nr:hypothetical protein [Sphingomonas kyeonggiensis]MBB4839496.1 hypothetical protein [Sphingomonas kyeonggiensis]
MRSVLLLLALSALSSCNQSNGKAADGIMGHRWARAAADCGDTYFRFSRDMIDFVENGQPVNSLPVRRIVSQASDPSTVMFVIEVDSALAARSDAPNAASDVAMAFRIEGDSLRLVGQGAPDKLLPVSPGTARFPTMALRRCPRAY